MGKRALIVENLGKRYRIGARRHDTLRDALMSGWDHLRRSTWMSRETEHDLWAIRDVSFEVQHGEIVGIIGRNGAGKSTLLKILSRITRPTEGQARIFGRVSALLEVGTGFHPELSGRENITLNGAILGMTRREITAKFDEIVSFAEISDLIDTPVKRYSSGMYVRLAFSVAAHLEPEILLVDEVLAVGDTAFQRKCLGQMKTFAGSGRTVLFVSHNMASIQALCSRGIFIRNGHVAADTDAAGAVSTYLKTLENVGAEDLTQRTERNGRGRVRLVSVEVDTGDGKTSPALATGRPARFAFRVDPPLSGVSCGFTVYDRYGAPVANFDSIVGAPQDQHGDLPHGCLTCCIDELLLVPGRYRLDVAIRCAGELQDHVEAARFVDVEPGHLRGRPVSEREAQRAAVCMHHSWQVP